MPGCNPPSWPYRFQPVPCGAGEPQPIAHAVTFHPDAFERHAHSNSDAQSHRDAEPNGNAYSHRDTNSNCLADSGRVIHGIVDANSQSDAISNIAALTAAANAPLFVRRLLSCAPSQTLQAPEFRAF